MAEDVDEDELTAEFTRELAKGMENLMKELQTEAGISESQGDSEEERTRLLKAAWEAMLVEGMNGEGGEDVQQMMGSDYKPKDAGGGADFQSKIKQTMNKLKQSESDLKVCYRWSCLLSANYSRRRVPLRLQILTWLV